MVLARPGPCENCNRVHFLPFKAGSRIRMPLMPDWSEPPSDPMLHKNEVHVWRAHLDCGPDLLSRLSQTLGADETARASRFAFARDRDHFVAGRGILRALLGSYLDQHPAEVAIAYEPEKKPVLSAGLEKSALRFNLSHSHGLAVYAFSCERELGVDVEAIRAEVAGEDIAERHFAPQELAELRGLPSELRDQGFFLCWTRKEAYVKARGAGLGIPLDSFTVSLTPGAPETLSAADGQRWTLRSFEPAPGYVGAVVGEGRGWNLLLWDWRPGQQ